MAVAKEEKETISKPEFCAYFKFGPTKQETFSVKADDIEVFAKAIAEMEGVGLEAIVSTSKTLSDLTDKYYPPEKKLSGLDLVKSELGGVETQSGMKCDHGWMEYKSGQGAKGPWSAYFCPTPKNTPGQCKPVDAKTGKPWG